MNDLYAYMTCNVSIPAVWRFLFAVRVRLLLLLLRMVLRVGILFILAGRIVILVFAYRPRSLRLCHMTDNLRDISWCGALRFASQPRAERCNHHNPTIPRLDCQDA